MAECLHIILIGIKGNAYGNGFNANIIRTNTSCKHRSKPFQYRTKYRHVMNNLFLFAIILIAALTSCQSKDSSVNIPNPVNGDLTTTFTEQPSDQAPPTPEQALAEEKERLVQEGWQEGNISNGLMPSCYNFAPTSDRSIDNYLIINVGSGTDVAAKLMNQNTGTCVRYVFINSSTSYTIRQIPQGVYYLKLAYGKEWLSKIESNQCVGRFLKNPMYEKGTNILDFNFVSESNGYSIPSYEISLDVISSSVNNSFATSNISETEFNK